MIYPVILSGGAGTRLWPLSRAHYPKQFLPLTGDLTMLQETANRTVGPNFVAPTFVCNDKHRFVIAEQMRARDIDPRSIILEPVARNTAPAIAVAALSVAEDDPDGLMLVMASDHVITDLAAFHAALDRALPAARAGKMLTFGLTPTAPETGYGYIKAGAPLSGMAGVFGVDQFVEKPDLKTAETYLAEGGYSWNSGIFLFTANRVIEELEQHAPDVLAAARAAYDNAVQDLDFCRLDDAGFAHSPSIAVDVAVMQETTEAAVVPVSMGWSDVGSWNALWQVSEQDENGNATTGDVVVHNSRDCLIKAEHGIVAAVGVENLVIVVTDDAVLVIDQDHSQDVKAVVEQLKAQNRSEHLLHRTVYRPWGNYRQVDQGERYQVKRITVKPGEKLSLQLHHHRSEHWVVVRGTARVTRDAESFLLRENESVYLPIGTTHRLENPGVINLELIEVQSGTYLGEDDIKRFQDTYGRVAETQE